MKVCSKCKIEKDESEFHKDKSQPTGLNYQCKECQKARLIIYRSKNIEKVKNFNKNSYQRNKKQRLNTINKYHNTHKLDIQKYLKEYRLKNYEKIKKLIKEYNEKNVKTISERYLIRLLKQSGFNSENISNKPELIDWKRFSVAKTRLEKLINKHKNKKE